jgi:hypothetical protein
MAANHSEIARELEDARRKLVILETYAERDSFTLYEAAMLAYGKDPAFFDDAERALAAFTGERTFGDVNSLYCEMLDAVAQGKLAAARVWTKRKEIDAARTTITRADFETFRAKYGRGTQPLPGEVERGKRQPPRAPTRGEQQEEILFAYLKRTYPANLMNLPRGAKADTKARMVGDGHFTTDTFKKAWSRLSTGGRIAVEGKDNYTSRTR